MSHTPSTLTLDAVCAAYDGRDILGPLDWSAPVTRLGIVGRNGSGKSTLARLLAGLVEPSAGKLRINGVDLAKDRKSALREVGILFQNPDHQIIFPTVLEEIAFGLTQLGRKKRAAEDEARAVLARFGKSHWDTVYCNALSQGQKHLVCLMAIVAMEPRLLILDEPFAGLDIPTKLQLRRHLRLYTGNIIHISHDPADLETSEMILWLDQGAIRRVGEAGAVLGDYVDAMTELGAGDDLSDLTG